MSGAPDSILTAGATAARGVRFGGAGIGAADGFEPFGVFARTPLPTGSA